MSGPEDCVRLAIEASGLGIWDADPRAGTLTWDAAAHAIHGLPADAPVDPKIFLDLVHPDDRSGLEAAMQAALDGSANGDYEARYRVICPDGAVRWVAARGKAFFAPPDEIRAAVRFTGTVMDITDQVRREEHIHNTLKLESLGVLAGGIAHAFNNLLTGILGNASMALDILPDETDARPFLEDALKASERAAELPRQLLAYSGKGQFVLKPVVLSDLVRDLSGTLYRSIPEGVELHLKLPRHSAPVHADATQLQEVVCGLINNAAEAIAGGCGIVTVSLEERTLAPGELWEDCVLPVTAPGCYVCLRVEDNGCGMDDATRARIFDPFFTTKFTGRGLGLAAVLGILRGHSGGIRVISAPGKGSTFEVLLPAAGAASVTASRRHPFPTGSGTVLVVDDEQIVRETSKHVLERCGYTVLLAENGQAGVEMFRRYGDTISLVLLDLSMPVMNGEAALEVLQSIRPDVRVVLSSGFSEAEAAGRFVGKGLAGFLQKPYTSRELGEKLREVMSA